MPKKIDVVLTENVKNHLRQGVPPCDIARMKDFAGRISISTIYGISNSLVSVDSENKAEHEFFSYSDEVQEEIVHEYLKRKKPPVIEFSTGNGVQMKYYHFSTRRTKTTTDCDKEETKEENDEENNDNDDDDGKDNDNDDEDDELEIDPTPSKLTSSTPSTQVLNSSSFVSSSSSTDPNLTSLLQYEKSTFRKNFNYVGFTSILTSIGGCVENGVILCVRLMFRKFKESFMKALVTLGLGFRSLSLEETLTMKSFASLSNHQLTLVRKYLHHKCERKILASDRQVRKALQETETGGPKYDQSNIVSVSNSKKRKLQLV